MSEDIIKVALGLAHIDIENMIIGKRYYFTIEKQEFVIKIHDTGILHLCLK